MKTTARKTAKKAAKHPHLFKWLTPEATAELGARIVGAGPAAHLEIREDESGGLHFKVVVPGAVRALEDPTDINDSRVCPPICPPS